MAIDAQRLARARAWREARGFHDLLTTEEVAARTGVSESVLRHGRLDGRRDLPQPLSVGRWVLYRRDDVERWNRDRVHGAVYRPPGKRRKASK